MQRKKPEKRRKHFKFDRLDLVLAFAFIIIQSFNWNAKGIRNICNQITKINDTFEMFSLCNVQANNFLLRIKIMAVWLAPSL